MTKLALFITLALIPLTLLPVGRTALPEGFVIPNSTKHVETIKSPSYATYEALNTIPISPQDYVRAEAQKYGWADGAEWSALNSLITGESGWQPFVYNSSSQACGLFQSLPCSKLGAPLENVANQASWGLSYIKRTYGTPSNAYGTWLSRSPHWY